MMSFEFEFESVSYIHDDERDIVVLGIRDSAIQQRLEKCYTYMFLCHI